MEDELGDMKGDSGPGMLAGVRVIEIADERAEYAGLLLAGLGAEVVKIEPPEGNATRRIGPFLEDKPGLERSLFFWNYNRNKKSALLDLRETSACNQLLRLLEGADVLLDSSCGALNEVLGLDRAALNERFPALVTARITPFGDDGPWKDFKGSDLIHLALGGVMMNCGYDPDPNLQYDLPPIAPQIWHAYHIAGEQLATGIIAALINRHRTGQGQDVSLAIHEAAVAAHQSARSGDTEPFSQHQSHQGRPLVYHPRHGCARPEEPRAAPDEICNAGRPPAAAAGR
jgi:crotonobetainyl-CoA:carnitine CoA-transferase CaiB-like acyl-CoA transferase